MILKCRGRLLAGLALAVTLVACSSSHPAAQKPDFQVQIRYGIPAVFVRLHGDILLAVVTVKRQFLPGPGCGNR